LLVCLQDTKGIIKNRIKPIIIAFLIDSPPVFRFHHN
jgi:hypothetical protein